MRNQIFISYSRHDKQWLARIKAHLIPLAEDEGVPVWDDTRLREASGKKFDDEIKKAILAARVAVLLVSTDYLNSDYIRKNELRPILEAAERNDVEVLWVAVSETNIADSGLDPIQALNEPARPLESLDSEELNAVLYDICERIVQRSLPPKVESGLARYLRTTLSLFSIVSCIAVVTVLFKWFLSAQEGFNSVFTRITLRSWTVDSLVFAGCILIITLCALYARHAFRSNQPPPAPAFLWRLFFNELPLTISQTVKPHTKLKALLVHDASTEIIANTIQGAYQQEPLLAVRLFKYTPALTTSTLRSNLDHADALYLFWTSEIKKNKQVLKTVLAWAIDQSHKPVLVVKFLPESECDINFKKVSRRDATAGVWQLLARSTERSFLWREQAKRYWLALLGTGGAFCLALLLLIPSLRGTGALERRDSVNRNTLNELGVKMKAINLELETLFATPTAETGRLDSGSQEELVKKRAAQLESTKEKVQQILKDFASYAVADLMNRQNLPHSSGETQLTFLRKTFIEKEWRIYQVAWSGERDRIYYYPLGTLAPARDAAYLIEGSFQHNAFILYRQDLKDGEEAAWNLDDQPLGYWDQKSGSVVFNSDKSKVFFPLRVRKDNQGRVRTALLCVVAPLDAYTTNGACLDTTLDPSSLDTKWAKHYLLRTLTVMQLLPDSVVITKKLLQEAKMAEPPNKLQ